MSVLRVTDNFQNTNTKRRVFLLTLVQQQESEQNNHLYERLIYRKKSSMPKMSVGEKRPLLLTTCQSFTKKPKVLQQTLTS